MKKKKLTGKLSLNKSKISALESAKVYGGTSAKTGPSPDSQVFCNHTLLCGSNITCDIGCQHLTDTQGSACKCL